MAMRLCLCVILLFASACQKETSTEATQSPAPAAPAQSDVCSTLTMDELNTAAGLKEAVGQSSKSGGAEVCTWTAGGKTVVVQVFPSASSYDQTRTALESQSKTTAEEVTAVGDKAFFVSGKTGPTPMGTLVAAKGPKVITVQLTGGSEDPATRKGEATAIAHVVLSRV